MVDGHTDGRSGAAVLPVQHELRRISTSGLSGAGLDPPYGLDSNQITGQSVRHQHGLTQNWAPHRPGPLQLPTSRFQQLTVAKFSNSDGGGVSPGGNPDSPPESNRPYPREGSESLPELTSFTQRYHYVNGGTINSFTDTPVELPISTAYATEQLPPDWHRLPGMALVPRASVDERQRQHQQYAPDEAGPLSRQQCSMQLQQYQHQRQHDGSTHNLQHHSQPAPPPPFPSSATPFHPSDFRVPTAQFPSSAFAPQWSPQHSQLPASNSDSVAAPLAYAWRTVTPNRTVPQQQLHPSLVNTPHPYATGVSNSGDGGSGSVGGPDRPPSTFSGLSGPPVSSSPSTSSISTVYEQGYHNDFPIVGPYGAVTQQGDRDSSEGWQQHQHLQHQQHHGDQEHYPGQHRTWNPNSWELNMRTETTTTAPIHKREVEFARPSSSTEPASKVPQYPSAFEGSFPLSKSLPAPKDGPIEAQLTSTSVPKLSLACHFCRGRKLKCDGHRGRCLNCTRRDLDCTYDTEIRRRGPGRKKKKREMELEMAAQVAAAQRAGY